LAIDPGAVRIAIAAQIKANISRDINTYGGYVPLEPTAPCALLMDPEGSESVEYGQTFGRPYGSVYFDVWVMINPGPATDGQRVIDECLSAGVGHANSIYDALVADPTLGGVAPDGLVVRTARRARLTWNAPSQTIFDVGIVPVEVYQPG
jgi:hypothetical protein